jgi:glutathione synthase/RimK-type ligase-like ATP-grasp enzyme
VPQHGDSLVARLLDVVAAAGRPGCEVATRLDLLLAIGPAYAWRRLRDDAAYARLDQGGRNRVYRDIWLDAATEVGAELEELGWGWFEIRASANGARTRVNQQRVPLDDGVTLRLAEDRRLTQALVAEAGLPVPEQLVFDADDFTPALDFLERHAGLCVVKPGSGTGGGEATTAGVGTPAQLRRARIRAARLASQLVIERQVPGTVYRLLFLDGDLLDVVRRHPPRAEGDGECTIRELIVAENRRRLAAGGNRRIEQLSIDLDCLYALEGAGLTLRSIPAAGEVVAVKTATNQNRAEDNETVREGVAPELVAEARQAADAIGVRLAGIDLITSDPGRSLRESGGVVIEVNGNPGLHHHYQVARREQATRVAVPILRRLLGAG